MKKSLEELRIESDYSQSEMARMLKIPTSTYYVYESGKRKVPSEIAEKIAKIFSKDINDIFLPATFTVSKTETDHTA